MESEAFERLHLVHARLLFVISEMFVKGRINDKQKGYLKCKFFFITCTDAVFKDEPIVFEVYESAKEDLDLLT